MPDYHVVLKYADLQQPLVLSELTGEDELSVRDVGGLGAINLLNRLLKSKISNENTSLNAESIVIADRDGILAVIYKQLYGGKIESTVQCNNCQKPFDIDFSLDDLQTHLQKQQNIAGIEKKEDGSFVLNPSCRFRLPTGEDELSVAMQSHEHATENLLKRCLLEGDIVTDGERVQEAMSLIAPVLRTEIPTNCPECGNGQIMQFDIQSFLLTRIKNEQKKNVWEIHKIAKEYGWSYLEISNLSRGLRQKFVSYINQESTV